MLRLNRIVIERRDGRHGFYRLEQPEMAAWILDGVRFLEQGSARAEATRSAIAVVKQI